MNIEMKEEYEKVYIEELRLSKRAYNMLKRSGINTLAELTERTKAGLSDVHGLGIQTINEIESIISNLDNIDLYKDEDNEETEEIIELSESTLNRSISELKANVRVLNALARGGVTTVGEMIDLKPNDIIKLRNLGAKSYRELMDIIQAVKEQDKAYFTTEQIIKKVKEYPKREFDIEIIHLLQDNYSFKTNWLTEWFNITRQRVDQKLKKRFNTGCWRGREFLTDEIDAVMSMVAAHNFINTVGEKSYYFLNNRDDDCTVIIVSDEEIKCFFLDDMPEELKARIIEEKMQTYSESEYSDWVKGEFITVLKKSYFNPYDTSHFRYLASARRMSQDEYAMFLYGVPYITNKHSVTDDKIIDFLEKNKVDGKVYIPATPETHWLRSFISRSGYTVDDFIKFYGYNTVFEEAATTEIDEGVSLFNKIEKEMKVYDCDGKFVEKVFARNPLLGNEIISEKNLQALYANSKNFIDQKVRDCSIQLQLAHDMQITLAVINYAKNWVSEDDSGFWRYITSQFGYRDENGKIREIICACVKNAMVKNRRWFVVTNTGYQYKSTIVIHAMTTKRTWMALCDFLFEFYKTNLDWVYIENDPIIERMVLAVGNKLSAADDSNIDDIEISDKVYWFQEGIKKLIVYKPGYAAKVLSQMIQRIDALINHEEKPAKTYLDQLCDEWIEQKILSLSTSGRTRHTGERRTVIIDYSRIRSTYQLKNEDNVVITVPDVRMEKNDFEGIRLYVYNNDKVIIDGKSLAFYGNELGKTLSGFTLNMNDLLKRNSDRTFAFRVVIMCDDDEIYNSGASLYRECLCFEGSRECGIERCTKGAYSVFIPAGHTVEFIGAESSIIREDTNIKAYYVQIGIDFVVNIDGKIIAFDNGDNNDIKVMMPRAKTDAEYIENGVRYSIVAAGASACIIVGPDFYDKQYRILLDGNIVEMSTLTQETVSDRIIYELPLGNSDNHTSVLQIADLMRNRVVVRKNIRVIEKLYYRFNREFYFSDRDFEDAVVSVRIDDKEMKAYPFFKKDVAIAIPYAEGEIEIHLPTIKVRDNYNNEWNGDNRYWVKEVKQNHFLYVKSPSSVSVVISVDGNEVAIENGDTFTFGNTVFGLDNPEDKKWTIVEMRVYRGDELAQKYELGRIAMVEQFAEKLKLTYEAGIFQWDSHNQFFGDSTGNFVIAIMDKSGQETKFPFHLDEGSISNKKELPIGDYRFEIQKQSANIFTMTSTTLAKGNFYVGDANELRFMNKKIVIDKITCEEGDRLEVIRIKESYIDNIEYVRTEFVDSEGQECPIYTGIMYFISDTKKKRKEYSTCEGETEEGYAVYKVNPIRIVYINDSTLSLTNEDEDGIYYYSYYDKYLEELVYLITDREPNYKNQIRYCLGDLYSYTKEGVDLENV